MSDLISRQAAIEAVKQAIYNHDSAIMRLTELPSVNPQEPKTGHWNTTDYFIFKCSECECEERTDTRFCPNCGAKMEGKA